MIKNLNVAAHVVGIIYGMLHVGFGDIATLTSDGSFYQIGFFRSVFNIFAFSFFLPQVQQFCFGGCFMTKLQAREERKRGEKETERFLPPWFSTKLLSLFLWMGIFRSALPLIWPFIWPL